MMKGCVVACGGVIAVKGCGAYTLMRKTALVGCIDLGDFITVINVIAGHLMICMIEEA